MHPVLVTGATGRVGRVVVDQLLRAGVPVRALTRRPAAAGLPSTVEIVPGDLTVPESLEPGLQGVRAVFLVWTAAPTTAPAVVERLATHAPRVVFFLAAPNAAPVLPTAESHGGLARQYRAPDCGRWPRVDDPPAGDVRVERVALVGGLD